MGDAAPRLGEQRRGRRLRWAIIAAALLTVLGARACSDRQYLSAPPSPSRMGALDGRADAGRLGRRILIFHKQAAISPNTLSPRTPPEERLTLVNATGKNAYP